MVFGLKPKMDQKYMVVFRLFFSLRPSAPSNGRRLRDDDISDEEQEEEVQSGVDLFLFSGDGFYCVMFLFFFSVCFFCSSLFCFFFF